MLTLPLVTGVEVLTEPTTTPATPALPTPEATVVSASTAPVSEAELGKLRAQVVTLAAFNAAQVVGEYATGLEGQVKLNDLISDFRTNVQEIWAGDLKQAESMLFGQAQALQAIFTHTARAARHADKLQHQEILLRMAFKAQAQCRATLETLANVKNPPVVFARQANIVSQGGQQQVNNTAPAPAPAGAQAPDPERTIRRRGAR